MRIVLLTFEAVIILLGIGVLGFWIIGHRRAPGDAISFLTSLAIDLALPSLILINLIQGFSISLSPDWWKLPLWWLAFTATALLLSFSASPLARKDIRSEFVISLFFQNGLFFPLVIINGIFGLGNPYLVSLFVFMAFHPSLVFGTYMLFFRNKGESQALNWRRIVNPVFVSTLIGVAISLVSANRYVPHFLLAILTMVAAMATPLFLLILGGNIYNDLMFQQEERRRFYWGEVMAFVMVKNLLFPLVFLGLLIWLKPDSMIAFIILLQSAVPPITAIPIFAERCGGNRALVSQYIVGSFIFSVFSIPAMIYLFNRFFSIPSLLN